MTSKIFINASTTNVFAPPGTNSKPFVCEAQFFGNMNRLKEVNEIIGKRFGKLVVLSFSHKVGNFKYFLCRCDCGKEKAIQVYNLLKGDSKSCGCPKFGKEAHCYRHGLRNSRLYYIWNGMRQRCGNPKNNHYKWYGERGIIVCEEWKYEFLPFYTWAINNGYEDALTIDRIKNDGNYEPSNCRWATPLQQSLNKSCNISLTYNGETLPFIEMAKKYNMNWRDIYRRIWSGWTIERAFTQPIKKKPRIII